MEVSVGDALVRWQELIQRVEAGEEIILTRQGGLSGISCSAGPY
jgi:antitoxin (DNA-binding transcriptional repressor) of toxin-antitoxin stability system